VPIVLKSGSLNLLEPSGPIQAYSGIALFSFYNFFNCGGMISWQLTDVNSCIILTIFSCPAAKEQLASHRFIHYVQIISKTRVRDTEGVNG
jgi:hypothetical protein